MKKSMLVIVIITIGILSWCTTVNATENIIDLGTKQYNNTVEEPWKVIIEHNQSTTLSYISSDIDNAALIVDDHWFSPTKNETTYIFIIKHISVNWWFKNDTKSFIFQDNKTKQLYRINVDYAEIEIPSDPVIEWMNKYNESASSFDELQDLFKTTLNDLNETRKNLEARWLIYNQSKDEFHNKTILAETLQQELEELDVKYNDTKKLWISATANASTYESYYRNLWDEHETLEKKYNDLSGIYPVYIFFAILGTSMIAIVFFKRKKILGLEKKSDIEIERDTGYSPKARRIDRFLAGFTNNVKPKDKGNPSPEHKQGIEDIHKKIDEIKKSHDTLQKSTVKDIQGIRKRVDFIETKLKITGA